MDSVIPPPVHAMPIRPNRAACTGAAVDNLDQLDAAAGAELLELDEELLPESLKELLLDAPFEDALLDDSLLVLDESELLAVEPAEELVVLDESRLSLR